MGNNRIKDNNGIKTKVNSKTKGSNGISKTKVNSKTKGSNGISKTKVNSKTKGSNGISRTKVNSKTKGSNGISKTKVNSNPIRKTEGKMASQVKTRHNSLKTMPATTTTLQAAKRMARQEGTAPRITATTKATKV